MKKYLTILIPAGAILFVILMAGFGGGDLKSSGGAPAGYTNSPGDGQNCSHCMGGTAVPVNSWITSNIPGTGYVPGTSYTITVTATGSGIKGFQVSPQDSAGNLIGTLTAGTGNKLVGGNKYVTHSSAQAGDPFSWSFQWKAPDPGVPQVTFWGTVAVGKLNTKITTFTERQSTVGMAEYDIPVFKVFPNPASNFISVSFTMEIPGKVSLDLLDAGGRVISNLMQELCTAGESVCSFSIDRPAGIYLLRISAEGANRYTRLIVAK